MNGRLPRRLLPTCLGAAVIGVVILGACGGSASDPPSTQRELRLVEEIDIPVREASGAAITRRDGVTRVSVIGDRTGRLASATYSDADGFGPWDQSDLADHPDWQVDDEDSQLEAITYVGDSTVAIMREDPSLITVGDPITGQVTAQITLVVSDAAQLPWDDAGSRGEGLVLLSDGRLLVAKEKDPAALIIFAPPGAPTGLAAADLLDVGTAWDAPEGAVDFEAVAIWPLAGDAADVLDDISGLAVGPDRSLWLLSDESARLARLALDQPLGTELTLSDLDEVLEIPDVNGKPEGVAVLGNNRFLITLDRDSKKNNGAIVELDG
jgi:uncharacterized protein YjiK